MASRLFAFGLLISIIAVFLPTSNEKSIGPTSTPSPTPSVGLCFLPQDSGICMAYFPRFYFNHKTKKCEKFIYGGCGGNQNNFLNKAACQFKCATISPQVVGILAKKSVLSTKKSVESRPAVGTPPKQSSVNNNTSISKTTPCLLQKKKALASNQTGLFLPECTQNGEYKTKQCWKPLGLTHTCWCVNKLGSKIGEVTKTANGIETCKSHRKTKREDSQCMRLVRMYHQNVPADHLKYAYIPQCDDYDGLFAIRQCFQATCWCVDKYNGAVVKNSFGSKSTLSCTHA